MNEENEEYLEWLNKMVEEDMRQQKEFDLMLKELNSKFVLGIPPRRDKYGKII